MGSKDNEGKDMLNTQDTKIENNLEQVSLEDNELKDVSGGINIPKLMKTTYNILTK